MSGIMYCHLMLRCASGYACLEPVESSMCRRYCVLASHACISVGSTTHAQYTLILVDIDPYAAFTPEALGEFAE